MSNNFRDFFSQIVQIKIKNGSVSANQQLFLTNFLKQHPEIKTIFETGFHVGLSAAVMMDVDPSIQVISSDIFWFDYTAKAKLYLDIYFPNRHTLLAGNSVNTLPTFFKQFPSFQPQFVFIDGGHARPVPLFDIYHILNHIKPGTWVMIDDYCEAHGLNGVIEAVNTFVEAKSFTDVQYFHDSGSDRGWMLGQRSETPLPDIPFVNDGKQIDSCLRDVASLYP
jgi:predicted O-methyltransferase YrrM